MLNANPPHAMTQTADSLLPQEKTLKFTSTEVMTYAGTSAKLYKVLCNGGMICNYHYWMLGSCGVAGLQNFQGVYLEGAGNYFNFWKDAKNIEKLAQFLGTKGVLDPFYNCEDVLCALSTAQMRTGSFEGFNNSPYIKLVDRFTNKAHGPCDMLIYRLSPKKDFKPVSAHV